MTQIGDPLDGMGCARVKKSHTYFFLLSNGEHKRLPCMHARQQFERRSIQCDAALARGARDVYLGRASRSQNASFGGCFLTLK
jgi:hypothetical protein